MTTRDIVVYLNSNKAWEIGDFIDVAMQLLVLMMLEIH